VKSKASHGEGYPKTSTSKKAQGYVEQPRTPTCHPGEVPYPAHPKNCLKKCLHRSTPTQIICSGKLINKSFPKASGNLRDMENGAPSVNAIEQDEAAQGLSRAAAARFVEKWKNAKEEKQESNLFWHSFFIDLLGITDLQSAGIEFEKRVISSKKGTTNYIDVFWKDTFLVEQKSAGKDLDAAEAQAREYVVSLPPALRPPIVLVCDFAQIRLVDILRNQSHQFALVDLPDNLDRIEGIVGHRTQSVTRIQVEADQKAAQLMADLYVQLEKNGYEGHDASVFMVRILFCLFADDTRMWKTDSFDNLVKDTNPLGSDLGPRLQSLFEVLDTAKQSRPKMIDEALVDFPYVNGGIFSERLPTFHFNTSMRNALMNACAYDWSSINPSIFGALFQDIKSKDERRAHGEHYTTEENIDKTIQPLLLDDLHDQLEKAWDSESKLKELQRHLGSIQVLDPACGCGNFLITTYKRLRQLELDIIVRLKQLGGTLGQTSLLDVSEDLFVRLEQLHGIEYVEWSSQIAKVAVYLADHQENMKLETVLGVAANRFPLTHSANIVQGNALQTNWAEVCPMTDNTVIVGNPPFLGYSNQTAEQKLDQMNTWGKVKGAGVLDYVLNWHLLAARYVQGSKARVAFVSTNSIVQGTQPSIWYPELQRLGADITFAHQTFAWESDASGKAAVHCVIIGFAADSSKPRKRLYTYATPKAEPVERLAKNINGYLLDAPDVLVGSRSKPLQDFVQIMDFGSKPTDEGYLSNISPEEAQVIRNTDPVAAKYLHKIIGAAELINGKSRFCLWLEKASPTDIKHSKTIGERAEQVKAMRSASTKAMTRKDAATPTLFQEIRQPRSKYLAVPSVSSENRQYVPMALMPPDVIVNNALLTISNADLFTFALLQSSVFNLWNATVSGRLESRFRISAEITYNNFPFPEVSADTRIALEDSGQTILNARAEHPNETLATLYDPLAMPANLRRAHEQNDRVTLKAYGLKSNVEDGEVLADLFLRYSALSKRE